MRIIRDPSGEYPDCLNRYHNFEKFCDNSTEEVFFYGYATPYNSSITDYFSEYKRKAYLQSEQPCGFYEGSNIIKQSLQVGNYFDEAYSTCPYTAKWLNTIHGYDKYRAVNFPYNADWALKGDIPEKPYDVIYWGNVPNGSKHVINILDTIIKFKHSFYTLGYGVPERLYGHITKANAPREEMWARLRQSKVMVTSNMLYLTDEQVLETKTCPRWNENEAFCRIDEKIMPQIKSRPIEAIMNKTLVVLKESPWRLFDMWFEPEKEFLYYKNDEDLEPLLKDITNNWESYKHIVDNAYNKAMKLYTTEKLITTIVNKELFQNV